MPGSLPQTLSRAADGPICIGHPSGVILVDVAEAEGADGALKAEYGAVFRTARRLFEGAWVYVSRKSL